MTIDIDIYTNFEIKLSRDINGIPTSFVFSRVSQSILAILNFDKSTIIEGLEFTKQLGLDFDFWLAFIVYTYNTEKTQLQYLYLDSEKRYFKLQLVRSDIDTLIGVIKPIDEISYNFSYTNHQEQLLETYVPLLNSESLSVFIIQYVDNDYIVLAENFQLQTVITEKDKGYWDLFSSDQQNIIVETCNQAIKTLKAHSSILKYGSHSINADFIPFFDNFGGRYILSTATDNTHVEEYEATVHLFDDYIQGFFSKLNAIIIVMGYESYKIYDANPYALNFYGYTKEEFLSMNVQDYNINPLVNSGTQALLEVPHQLKDGSIRYLDIYPNIITIAGYTVRISISYDVTDRVTLSKRLESERTLLRTTLNSITDAVVTLNKDNKIIGSNFATKEILGLDFSSYVEVDSLKMRNSETLEIVSVDHILNNGLKQTSSTSHFEIKSIHTDWIPISYTISPIINDGENNGNVIVFRNIQKDMEYIKQMRYLSYHDTLTGLYNRRYLQMKLESKTNEESYPMALIMADANDLKRVNDIYGHHMGDQFLVSIAKTLLKHFSGDAIVSRWGGDEFLVMVPNANLIDIDKTLNLIREDSDPMQISLEPTEFKPNFAMGYTIVEKHDTNLSKHIALAERYMYREKRISAARFRNRVVDGYLMQLYEIQSETKKHSMRLESLCFAMGSRLSLTPSQMESLSSLALLHDIGKTKIDAAIIDKPAKLSDEEWEIMRKHPKFGYEIAIQFPELSTVAYLILTHHERFDGKGYPLNLKEENIPIESRILAIVDAFDAMTHDRPYHKAISTEAAIQELKDNAGTQFDPILVKTFTELPPSLLNGI